MSIPQVLAAGLVAFRLISVRFVVVASVVLGLTAAAMAKDLALVAHKSNSLSTMTQAELVKICKGLTNHWPDGKPVTLILRDPASSEMKMVLEKIYAIPKEDVAAIIATANHGRSSHPAIIVVDSDENVVQRVESTPGAVGLVDVYSITGGVTVLKIAGKLPLEPGYLLHGN